MVLSGFLMIIVLLNFMYAAPAYAYLDPNAGGFFLQVVIPFVFAIAAAITIFWRRLVGQVKDIITRLTGRIKSKSVDN
jgi:hypothetical protein